MKKRLASLIAVALLCVSNTLTACTPKEESVPTTTTSVEATTTASSAEQTDVTTTTDKQGASTQKDATITQKVETTKATTTKEKVPTAATTTSKTTVVTTRDEVTTVVTTNKAEQTTTSSSRRTVSTKSRATTTEEPVNQLAQIADRINNNLSYPAEKIATDKVLISGFEKQWAFKHHPALGYFKGRLYAAHTRGYEGEDHPGQHMVVSYSDDFFHWSEPKIIGPSVKGTAGETVVFPVGMFVSGDRLYMQYYIRDFAAECFDANGRFNTKSSWKGEDYCYLTWTDDGENWSEPQNIPHGYILGQGLRKSFVSGKWLSAWGAQFFSSSDQYPDIFNFNENHLSNEQRADAKQRNGGKSLTESSWYETADGVCHILIRSDTGYLWHFQTDDDGKTLSDPYPTRFHSTNSQLNFIQTSTDFIIGVGEPYNPSRPWDAYPLQLWISEDGYNFNKSFILQDDKYQMQQPGYSKGCYYAYPSLVIEGDYLYILYSKMKEVIEITRVKLSDLKK